MSTITSTRNQTRDVKRITLQVWILILVLNMAVLLASDHRCRILRLLILKSSRDWYLGLAITGCSWHAAAGHGAAALRFYPESLLRMVMHTTCKQNGNVLKNWRFQRKLLETPLIKRAPDSENSHTCTGSLFSSSFYHNIINFIKAEKLNMRPLLAYFCYPIIIYILAKKNHKVLCQLIEAHVKYFRISCFLLSCWKSNIHFTSWTKNKLYTCE